MFLGSILAHSLEKTTDIVYPQLNLTCILVQPFIFLNYDLYSKSNY